MAVHQVSMANKFRFIYRNEQQAANNHAAPLKH